MTTINPIKWKGIVVGPMGDTDVEWWLKPATGHESLNVQRFGPWTHGPMGTKRCVFHMQITKIHTVARSVYRLNLVLDMERSEGKLHRNSDRTAEASLPVQRRTAYAA